MITGGEFLAMRVSDNAVHAWTLHAPSVEMSGWIRRLVRVVLDVLHGWRDGPGFGIVPLGWAGRDGPPKIQLLELSGRR